MLGKKTIQNSTRLRRISSKVSKKQFPVPSEHAEQVTFVSWFRASFPGVLIYAIPNGGGRHILTAIDLKAEGVTPGIPDLHIPRFKLWIEMKRTRGGEISKEQKEVAEYLTGIGDTVCFCEGHKKAIAMTIAFLRGLNLPKLNIRLDVVEGGL